MTALDDALGQPLPEPIGATAARYEITDLAAELAKVDLDLAALDARPAASRLYLLARQAEALAGRLMQTDVGDRSADASAGYGHVPDRQHRRR